MTDTINESTVHEGSGQWLKRYYLARAAFSVVWVAAAFAVPADATVLVAALFLVYPAWDAAANVVDAQRSGGLRRNPTQAFNAAVSAITTGAVAVALTAGMNAVLGVFGVWAAMSGLLQLATAVRRWRKSGAQWAMLLSGVQSTAAGVMFLIESTSPEVPNITVVAPYVAFGAFYFLLAGVWLIVRKA
ncbi:hypothetical protein BVC93_13215 [Mycobacterium sp. MS1601]|uniref:DUF308 domain-containing protein n=1 Tax=Mycobacterium sp. MS1601 TaxID=1936029 RepID=UPI00097974FE|nr:DUF308 domain-containing protein [Mycobacterium sp. MS1601]AQA03219.1 hypothetical protein BVC93_13215 [Mycobacterium sp. MS1601]